VPALGSQSSSSFVGQRLLKVVCGHRLGLRRIERRGLVQEEVALRRAPGGCDGRRPVGETLPHAMHALREGPGSRCRRRSWTVAGSGEEGRIRIWPPRPRFARCPGHRSASTSPRSVPERESRASGFRKRTKRSGPSAILDRLVQGPVEEEPFGVESWGESSSKADRKMLRRFTRRRSGTAGAGWARRSGHCRKVSLS